jgi:DNA-binding response OmpR family regulator
LKLLLIEDNHTIAKQVAEFLTAHQWQVDHAHNGKLAIQLASAQIYDVVLLDLNLPDIDGLDVCTHIKKNAPTTPPILMLTARDSFDDKFAGFKQGADDYLTKPFDLRELALRCNALTKRQNLHRPQTLTVGELTLDLNEKSALRQDTKLKLTTIGFDILAQLANAYPEPLSRSALTHFIWADEPPDSDALKSHIYALRKALDKPFSYPMLTTIMNVGYKLEVVHETH